MDQKTFKEVVARTRLTLASREAARQVLVEGVKPVDVADATGLSQVRISQIVKTVREAQERLQADRARDAASQAGQAFALSYIEANNLAKQRLGNNVSIEDASVSGRYSGAVVAQTDYHVLQHAGLDSVVIHDRARLDRSPELGRSVTIQYKDGRGVVGGEARERSRAGRSL